MQRPILQLLLYSYVFKEVWSKVEDIVYIPAFNRAADIGHMYNHIADKFLLVKPHRGRFPKNHTYYVNTPNVDMRYTRIRSFSDQLDSFGFDMSAQVSLLFGAVETGGSVSYLKENSIDEEHSHACLSYRTTITTELLALYLPEVLSNIDIHRARMLGAEYYIIGIEWGTDSLVSMKWKSSKSGSTVSKGATVNFSFNSPKFSAEMESSFQSLRKELKEEQNLEFSLYGNVALSNISVKSFEDIDEFITNVPEMTKKVNRGKGSPMKYIGISLDKLELLFQNGTNLNNETLFEEMQAKPCKQDIEIFKLESKMKSQYEEYKQTLDKLKRCHQIISQNEYMLPTGSSLDFKQTISNFNLVAGSLKIEMKHLLEASRHSSSGLLERFEEIRKFYEINPDGKLSAERAIKTYENYSVTITLHSWLTTQGVFLLQKDERLEEVKIRHRNSSTVHVFITNGASKELEPTKWYEKLGSFIGCTGSKIFVDCDLKEIWLTSCGPYTENLKTGAVLMHYRNRIDNLLAYYVSKHWFHIPTV